MGASGLCYADTLSDIRLGFCIVDLYIKIATEGKTPIILMPCCENCMIVNELLIQKTSSDHVKPVTVERLSSVFKDKWIEREGAEIVAGFVNDKKTTAVIDGVFDDFIKIILLMRCDSDFP
ncbi:hypothetical protein QYM36_011573 [Artemia franciscana]|uniref:Uncharacterized protein n=1 Tax=Artemia franciscana TaxID=6661 RepID=A0AA88HNV3_ARTSF|nr:hypothetical protein QYM36_011573 [Artemia franciscana]